MRYSSVRPPHFRSQSRGLGRMSLFLTGLILGALVVFLGMTAWQSNQPVEIILKNQDTAIVASAILPTTDTTDYMWSEGQLLGIKTPKENDRVSGSVKVEGLANPPNGTVHARVSELIRGKVVTIGEADATVKFDVPGTHGPFSMIVTITPTRNQGTLEISVLKNKTGKDTDAVIIPLQFEAEKNPAATVPEKPTVTKSKPATPTTDAPTPAVVPAP